MFCLVPTIRFEDIYFGDHYNSILFLFFVALCKMWQSGKTFGIWRCMWNSNDTSHAKFGIRPRRRFLFRNLRWRGDDLNKLINRCDASMSLIMKFGAVFARPKPSHQNKCKQKILTLQGLEFVRLNRLGGEGVGRCVALLLFYTMIKKKISC